jgi:hypothetical protein
VFQAFLTTFLIDSGYKTPIQNMEELFNSGIKLAYLPAYSRIFDIGDEKEASKVKRNLANCPSFAVCMNWAMYQKNVSIFMSDIDAELQYANGIFVGENSERLLCRLEDGVFFNTGQSMLAFHGDPLLKRVNEIIVRVVEAGIYNYWISLNIHIRKVVSRKIRIKNLVDEYYNFSLNNLQPAFYLLLMGWFLSALCVMVELLYNRVLCKIILS